MATFRIFIFTIAVCGWLACGAQANMVDVDNMPTEDPELVDNIDSIEVVDDFNTDSVIAAASAFTPDELNSPMMTDGAQKTTTGNTGTLIDWCLEHLFLSGMLALAIIGGGIWVIYRLCRYFFITRKKL